MNKQKDSFSRFSFKRTMTVTKRVLRQIIRDRRTFVMINFIPLVIMLIFGFALSGELTNIPIVIENNDPGYPLNSPIINAGTNISNLLAVDNRVDVTYGNYTASFEDIDNGKYFAAILIPENFSETIFQKMVLKQNVSFQLFIYVDGTKPTILSTIMGALRDAIEGSIPGGAGIELVQQLAFGGAQYSGLEIGIPGVMALILSFLLVLISGLIMIREKLSGTLNRLFCTPLSAVERLTGFSIALVFLGLLMVTVVLLVGTLVFGAPVKGSIALLIFACVLYALTHVLLAVFLSNFAENELQAVQMAPIISLPSLALSGVLVPVVSLPSYLRPIAYILPMTYGVNIFEGIMLKGWGFKQLWPDFLVVIGMTILFMILAFVTVKDKMDD